MDSLIALVVQPAYVGLLGLVTIALGLTKIWQWRKGVVEHEAEGKSTSAHGNVAAIGAIFMAMTFVWVLFAKWLTHHRTIRGSNQAERS